MQVGLRLFWVLILMCRPLTEIILKDHTGYITDAGMTGPELSVLGVSIEAAVDKQRFKYPVRFTEAQTACFINGVVISFDEKSGKCTKIKRIINR